MRDAEVHAAPAGEHFAANAAVHRVGITSRLFLRKVDTHLHRPCGMHRVETTKQRVSQRHHADEVIEDAAQVFLRARCAQAISVSLAGGRTQLQRAAYDKRRHMDFSCTPQDFILRDLAHIRHGWVHLVSGLLLGDREHRADVFRAGVDFLGIEGGVDVLGPPRAVGHLGRQQPHDLRLHFGFAALRLLRVACGGATSQHHQSGKTEDQTA